MSAVRRARLADLPTIVRDDPADPEWTPVRHHLGIRAFGVNAFVGRAPGDIVIERHDEVPPEGWAAHEELYVVLEGEAAFVVGDERFTATAGELVMIADAELVREARAVTAPTWILAAGAAPGVAYTPSPWETRELARHADASEAS